MIPIIYEIKIQPIKVKKSKTRPLPGRGLVIILKREPLALFFLSKKRINRRKNGEEFFSTLGKSLQAKRKPLMCRA